MSATDDPSQGFGEAGDDPMSSGAPGQEHEDPSEGGEAFGEDPSGGAPGEEHEDPSEGGEEFGEDPSAP
jgi:hypothetical protein